MDPALLKDLNDFKKRSLSQPTVESKKAKTTATPSKKSKSSNSKHSNLPKQLQPNAKKTSNASTVEYKRPTIRSKHRFAVLHAIVEFMKARHLNRKTESLSLDEILDKIKYTDISNADKTWLRNEALTGNAKLVNKDGKFTFNPKYHIKDKKQLLKLLGRHQERGIGGVLLDDIRESLPEADDVVKSARKRITFITGQDKKVVLFFKNNQHSIKVEEEFQQHWRSVSVDSMGEADIDKYLVNAGIATMQNYGSQKIQAPQRKRAVKKKRVFKKLNVHLDESTLKEYPPT